MDRAITENKPTGQAIPAAIHARRLANANSFAMRAANAKKERDNEA